MSVVQSTSRSLPGTSAVYPYRYRLSGTHDTINGIMSPFLMPLTIFKEIKGIEFEIIPIPRTQSNPNPNKVVVEQREVN